MSDDIKGAICRAEVELDAAVNRGDRGCAEFMMENLTLLYQQLERETGKRRVIEHVIDQGRRLLRQRELAGDRGEGTTLQMLIGSVAGMFVILGLTAAITHALDQDRATKQAVIEECLKQQGTPIVGDRLLTCVRDNR